MGFVTEARVDLVGVLGEVHDLNGPLPPGRALLDLGPRSSEDLGAIGPERESFRCRTHSFSQQSQQEGGFVLIIGFQPVRPCHRHSKAPCPPSLLSISSRYKMDGFLSSTLSVIVALLGAFAVVVAAATTTVTQSDEQSGLSILPSSFDGVQSVARYTSSFLQQRYSLLRAGDSSLYRMVQCLTLCGLLPGLWLLRPQRGRSNDGTNGSVRSYNAELKGNHDGVGSIGSADSALRNGMFQSSSA